MGIGNLKRSLHRELTRNPAKSATLLALIPVAGYFIGPLVWKQLPFSKGGTTNQPTFLAVADNGASATTTATGTVAVASPQSLPRWQDVAEWIGQDARMKSSTAVRIRDPFQPVSNAAELQRNAEQKAEQEPVAAASVRPEDCGLELTATIVGRAKRLATINGRLYSESARVNFENNDRSQAKTPQADNAFILQTVAKNYVVLERHGELFRLPIVGTEEK